jgi:hypothetical protein
LGEETSVAVIESEVPMAMRKLYRRLERWRSNRQGRSRIPESLWAAAGELAREHGVNPVSRVLHLEFNHLKRVAESDRRRTRKPPVMSTFVELVGPPTAMAAPECIVEVEGPRGKIRIEWKGTATDLATFSRALWEMIS